MRPLAGAAIGAGSYIGYCAAIGASLLLINRLGARNVAATAGAQTGVDGGTGIGVVLSALRPAPSMQARAY